MTDEVLTDLREIALPYSKRMILREVKFASGMTMTRMVIFEGKRVTQVDLDAETAEQLAGTLMAAART